MPNNWIPVRGKIWTEKLEDLVFSSLDQGRHNIVIGLPGCGKGRFLEQYKEYIECEEKYQKKWLAVVYDVYNTKPIVKELAKSVHSSLVESGIIEKRAFQDEIDPVKYLEQVFKDVYDKAEKRIVVIIKSFEQIRKLNAEKRADVGNALYEVFNGAAYNCNGPVLVLESDRDLGYIINGAQNCKTKFESIIGSPHYLTIDDYEFTRDIVKKNCCEDVAVAKWLFEKFGSCLRMIRGCHDDLLGREMTKTNLEAVMVDPGFITKKEEWVKQIFRLLDDIKISGGTLKDFLVKYICDSCGNALPKQAELILKSKYGIISSEDGRIPDCILRHVKESQEGCRKLKSEGVDYKKYIQDRERILKLVERKVTTPILLRGEKGCGKTYFVDEICKRGNFEKPCKTYSFANGRNEDVVQRELFGSVRGAYTDADDKKGVLEEAEGSVLFIDEIAKSSVKIQDKLLRVIENRKFSRIGEAEEREANVLFVCACREDIDSLTKKDPPEFSPDLYDRLKQGNQLTFPALSQIKKEIKGEQVVNLLMRCCKDNYKEFKLDGDGIQPLAKSLFLNFIRNSEEEFTGTEDRPGNWRQLKDLCGKMLEKEVLGSSDNKKLCVSEQTVRLVLQEYYGYSENEIEAFAVGIVDQRIKDVLKKEGKYPDNKKLRIRITALVKVFLTDEDVHVRDVKNEDIATRWVNLMQEEYPDFCNKDWKQPLQVIERTLRDCKFSQSVSDFENWVKEKKQDLKG